MPKLFIAKIWKSENKKLEAKIAQSKEVFIVKAVLKKFSVKH